MFLDTESKYYLQYIVGKTFYGDVTITEMQKVVDELMQSWQII